MTYRDMAMSEVDSQISNIVEGIERILGYVRDEDYDREFIAEAICGLLDSIG